MAYCCADRAAKTKRVGPACQYHVHTQRFGSYVGQRCSKKTITDTAGELHSDWDSVAALDKQCLRAKLAWTGTPGTKIIRIDEISIWNDHTDRIVVNSLIRGSRIWFRSPERVGAIGRL